MVKTTNPSRATLPYFLKVHKIISKNAIALIRFLTRLPIISVGAKLEMKNLVGINSRAIDKASSFCPINLFSKMYVISAKDKATGTASRIKVYKFLVECHKKLPTPIVTTSRSNTLYSTFWILFFINDLYMPKPAKTNAILLIAFSGSAKNATRSQ